MSESLPCSLICVCGREFYGNVDAMIKHNLFECQLTERGKG